jgi:hypothetical protein
MAFIVVAVGNGLRRPYWVMDLSAECVIRR